MTSSSTKAHNGSQKGTSSRTSTNSHKHKHSSSTKKKSSEERVERFVQDTSARDYRSLAVEEFDDHQEAARQSHLEELKDVVEKNY